MRVKQLERQSPSRPAHGSVVEEQLAEESAIGRPPADRRVVSVSPVRAGAGCTACYLPGPRRLGSFSNFVACQVKSGGRPGPWGPLQKAGGLCRRQTAGPRSRPSCMVQTHTRLRSELCGSWECGTHRTAAWHCCVPDGDSWHASVHKTSSLGHDSPLCCSSSCAAYAGLRWRIELCSRASACSDWTHCPAGPTQTVWLADTLECASC